MMDHRYGKAQWGPNGTRVRTSAANWRKPLAWNRAAEKAGERHRVFCASLADVFEDWQGPIMNSKGQRLSHVEGACEIVATMDDLRRDLFSLIDQTPHLDWLLLTKRPENVCPNWPFEVHSTGDTVSTIVYRPNVWIGTSISDQASADKQIPKLLECRDLCPVLFLSAEPLLGPIDLRLGSVTCDECGFRHGKFDTARCVKCGNRFYETASPRVFDWVIAGGESGHGSRPMHPDCALSIRDQCQRAEVPFFFKQWGEWSPIGTDRDRGIVAFNDGRSCEFTHDAMLAEERRSGVEHNRCHPQHMYRVGKAAAGRLLDGREWSEFPQVAERV